MSEPTVPMGESVRGTCDEGRRERGRGQRTGLVEDIQTIGEPTFEQCLPFAGERGGIVGEGPRVTGHLLSLSDTEQVSSHAGDKENARESGSIDNHVAAFGGRDASTVTDTDGTGRS